ncbi:hypothetical protein BT67DRAFT_108758 [Trichocladium antarcticum]|uniref:Uncharacterized protein n=1 Tax=Trichocladium antarcticum TaxID=1450529 RepID=A0AAN6ZH70_9PEZI|nr:hypothetical protein BT67DRAFT_108758 [Trichocladium antarcticum]
MRGGGYCVREEGEEGIRHRCIYSFVFFPIFCSVLLLCFRTRRRGREPRRRRYQVMSRIYVLYTVTLPVVLDCRRSTYKQTQLHNHQLVDKTPRRRLLTVRICYRATAALPISRLASSSSFHVPTGRHQTT